MPIFGFIGHVLTKLFGKTDNWQKLYEFEFSIHQTKVVSKITCYGEEILVVTFLYMSR